MRKRGTQHGNVRYLFSRISALFGALVQGVSDTGCDVYGNHQPAGDCQSAQGDGTLHEWPARRIWSLLSHPEQLLRRHPGKSRNDFFWQDEQGRTRWLIDAHLLSERKTEHAIPRRQGQRWLGPDDAGTDDRPGQALVFEVHAVEGP